MQYLSTHAGSLLRLAFPTSCWPASPATVAFTCLPSGRTSRAPRVATLGRLPLCRGRLPHHPPVHRRRDRRRQPARHVPRGVRGFRDPAVAPLRELAPWPLRARAFPWADARLQGRRHAAPRPAHGPRAGEARPADDHRRRHFRRHRGGGDRGVPRPRQCRYLHPVSGRARVAVPAAADDHRRRAERSPRLPSAAPSTTARRS